MKGKVLRIQPFGAFVEILPGVDGLIHVSNMSDTRVQNPREVVKEGDKVILSDMSRFDTQNQIKLEK